MSTAPRSESLSFYRVTIVGLLLVISGLSVALQREVDVNEKQGARLRNMQAAAAALAAPQVPPPAAPRMAEPPLRMTDIGDHVAAVEHDAPDQADFAQTFFETAAAVVHMHVIGKGQTCPLHVHRKSHEATFIVSGAPEVLQIYSHDHKKLLSESGVAKPGTLVYSPPFVGHRWSNVKSDQMQANLVFTAPPFDGNLYVAEDDSRMLAGDAPRRIQTDELLELCPATEPSHLEHLPIMQGMMDALIVRAEASLPPIDGPRVVYVVRGAGTLTSQEGLPVHANQLFVTANNVGLTLRATEPSVLLVFTPGKPGQRAPLAAAAP